MVLKCCTKKFRKTGELTWNVANRNAQSASCLDINVIISSSHHNDQLHTRACYFDLLTQTKLVESVLCSDENWKEWLR